MIDQPLVNDLYNTKNKISEFTNELISLNDLLYDIIEKIEVPTEDKQAIDFINKRMTELLQHITNLNLNLTELRKIFYKNLC